MKLDILDSTKNKVGEIELPFQFKEEPRQDLIHRAVLVIQSHKRQSYAASEHAGKRASAKLSRRRRDYRGSYGFVNNSFILVKGSIAGSQKRLIRFTDATRSKKNTEAFPIAYISTESKQGT